MAPVWRLRVRNRALSQNLIVDRQAGRYCVPLVAGQVTISFPSGYVTTASGTRFVYKRCCVIEGGFRRRAAFFELIAELDAMLPGRTRRAQ